MKKILIIGLLMSLHSYQQPLQGASTTLPEETKAAAALPVGSDTTDADYEFIQKAIHARYPYKVTDSVYAIDPKQGYSPKLLKDTHCGTSVKFMLSLLTDKDATPIMTSRGRGDDAYRTSALKALREDMTLGDLVAAVYLEEDMHSFVILRGNSNGNAWYRTFESCAELYTLSDWIDSGKLLNVYDPFFQERHTEFGERKKLLASGYLMPKYLVTTTNYYNAKIHPHNLRTMKIVLYPYSLQKDVALPPVHEEDVKTGASH